MSQTLRPIVIAGLPRSGTTWVGEVFASDKNSRYIFEPDNEKLSPLAWLLKKDLHRFPYLTARDESPAYYRLWTSVLGSNRASLFANRALGYILKRNAGGVEAGIGDTCGLVYVDKAMHRVGGRAVRPYSPQRHLTMKYLVKCLERDALRNSTKRRTIIKSVHACLSLDWLSGNFPITSVFVLRNPYSLYASYKRLRMPDGFRNLLLQANLQRDASQYLNGAEPVFFPNREDTIAFQIMLMYKIIQKQLAAHPEWLIISHDRLCMTPNEGYRSAFDRLELSWSEDTNSRIDTLNQTGGGFTPKRIASQQPSKWKTEMGEHERSVIEKWISYFELQDFLQTHINLN
jgi:hypothetical protein